mgnify:CR=1 FL=1
MEMLKAAIAVALVLGVLDGIWLGFIVRDWLVNSIAAQPFGAQWLGLAGPGFRDLSRIAASDPLVWRDILLANRAEVLAQLRLLQTQLQRFEQTMSAADGAAVERLIAQASRVRSNWQMGAVGLSADPASE